MARYKDKEMADRLESAISRLITFSPIFGNVFLYLNKRESESIPTMGVGVIRRVDLALYYNVEFVRRLTSNELKAVLIHEALHVLLHHMVRATHFNLQHKAFNVAADMAINCNIEGLFDGVFYPKTFNLPDYKSAEWYYESLKKKAEESGKSGPDGLFEGKGQLVDDHSTWGECEEDIVKEKIRRVAADAIKEQDKRGWGSVPGKLYEQIMAANKPVVNWKKEVRYFINQLVMAGRRYTRMRPNRRYGYANPGSKRDFTSKLLVAVDTSGSMSRKELSLCLTEINGMSEHVMCEVIMFDTQLYDEPVLIKKKLKALDVKGRGGTNFEPVMRLVEERKYDGLIILTDGFAPFPEKPKSTRVLWCLTPSGKEVQPPYGKRVVIDVGDQ